MIYLQFFKIDLIFLIALLLFISKFIIIIKCFLLQPCLFLVNLLLQQHYTFTLFLILLDLIKRLRYFLIKLIKHLLTKFIFIFDFVYAFGIILNDIFARINLKRI